MAEALGMAAATAQFLDVALRLSAMLSQVVSEYRDAPRELPELANSVVHQISLVELIREDTDHLQVNHKDQCDELNTIITEYCRLMDAMLHQISRILGTGPKNGIQRSWTALLSLHKKSSIKTLSQKMDVQRYLLLLWISNANRIFLRDLGAQAEVFLPLIKDTNTATASIRAEIGETRLDIHRISRNVNHIEAEVRRLGEQLRDFGSFSRMFESLVANNEVLQNSIRDVARGYENMADNKTPPYDVANRALMKTQIELLKPTDDHTNTEPLGASDECRCRKMRQTTRWEPLSLLHFKRVFTRHHYASCPQFEGPKQSLEVTMHLVPPQWLLNYTIQMSLALWRWRDTGVKFVPTGLNVPRVVDTTTSASFRAIQHTREKLSTHSYRDSSRHINDLRVTLGDIFQAGEASALDVSVDGASLLHEALWLFTRHRSCGGIYHAGGHVPGEKYLPGEEYLHLVRFLLQAGAQPNCELTLSSRGENSRLDYGTGTVFDVFASTLFLPTSHGMIMDDALYLSRKICHELDQGGAYFSRVPLSETHPMYRAQCFWEEVANLRAFPEHIELCDHGPLVPIILTQSKEDLVQLIGKCDVNHVSMVNGLCAVHFAVDWPCGLKILIDAGADVDCEDFDGRRPINLAVELGRVESVYMLIKADCCLWTVSKSLRPVQKACFQRSLHQQNISGAIVDGTINRLQRIHRLGAASLPLDSPLCEVAQSGTMSEHIAVQIVSELTKSGKRVPEALKVNWSTGLLDSSAMHGDIRIPVETAESYWQAGFQDVTAYDDRGFNPMLHCWFAADFELMKWLAGKGAPVSARHLHFKYCGLHYYARRLEYPGAFFRHDTKNVPSPSADQAHELWKDSDLLRDDCTCLCSPLGCTPISTLFARYYPSKYRIDIPKDGNLLTTFWEKTATPSELRESHLVEFLRVTLFDLMDCDHTCCWLGQECDKEERPWLGYKEQKEGTSNKDKTKAYQRFLSEFQLCLDELAGYPEERRNVQAVVSILSSRQSDLGGGLWVKLLCSLEST